MSIDDPVRAPSQSFVIEQHIRAALASLRTCMVGRVVRYDADAQQVDVQPLVKDWYTDEEGARVVEAVPVIANVPVQFLTAGGFTFTVPIVASDTNGTIGTLWFAERSLDRWLAGTGGTVDPEVYLRHALTDGIFMPGVSPFGAPMSVAPPTDHATAGSITGKRLHFHESLIIAGDSAAAQFMAKANDVLSELQDVASTLAGHVHTAGTLTAPPGGGAVTGSTGSSNSTYTASSVAATVLKSE